MPSTEMKRVIELLDHFEHAMLVTKRGAALRSRPMAIANHTDDGRIRFITRDDSAKLEELEDDDQVNVALQGEDRFLSISGHARLTKDDALIEEAWSESQSVWFSEGKRDPHVIVLEVVPTYAEYWDRTDFDVMDLVVEKARAAAGGRLADTLDPETHGDVDLRDKPL